MRWASFLVVPLLLAGCSSSEAPGGGIPKPLEDAVWQNATVEAGESMWLNYGIYNTTVIPFEWFVHDGKAVQFTVYRTKSSGEEVLYNVTAPQDASEVTARHPNIHSLVWRNINEEVVTIQLRVPEGYTGERYGPGADPAKTNCPALCMQS